MVNRLFVIGAWAALLVFICWLAIGGMLAKVPALPYGGALILAILVGIVLIFWNFTSKQIDEFLASTLGRLTIILGYISWFCIAVRWVHEMEFVKGLIDTSPRGQWFIALLAVTLAHGSASSGFRWAFQIEKPVFRNMTVSAFLSATLLFMVAEIKQPKALFNPETGVPTASVDSEGNVHYNHEFSPSTGEKLSPITKEEAKKIKPWWQDSFESLKKDLLKDSSPSTSSKTPSSASAPAPAPAITRPVTPVANQCYRCWGYSAYNTPDCVCP